jgi:hypothetical protein
MFYSFFDKEQDQRFALLLINKHFIKVPVRASIAEDVFNASDKTSPKRKLGEVYGEHKLVSFWKVVPV